MDGPGREWYRDTGTGHGAACGPQDTLIQDSRRKPDTLENSREPPPSPPSKTDGLSRGTRAGYITHAWRITLDVRFKNVGHTISVFPYSTCTGQFSPSLRSRRSSQGINTPTVCLSECKARQCDSFLGREELPRVPQWALCRDDAEVARLLQHGLDPGGPSSCCASFCAYSKAASLFFFKPLERAVPSAPTAWRALSLFKPPHTVHGPTQGLLLRASPPLHSPLSSPFTSHFLIFSPQ
ncbi:hypothetical protein O3P69_011129 [Scylla paramamosain]|uniref:Uncharacterized protein n=1 Tax=Scylla paramamosain TaxID=85552 RepID=A0AAW0STT1_SCYPA